MYVCKTHSADRSHCVVDASWTKPPLDDLEATPFTKHKVAGWNPDVVEADVPMSVGSIIVTIDIEHPVDGHPLSVCRYQHNRLLTVDVLVVRVGLAHDDVDFAPRVARTARPPFLL